MAISAATGANRIVRGGPGKTLFEDGKTVSGSGSTWKQGVFLAFDTTAHALKQVAAYNDSDTFAGISDNVVSAGKLAEPYSGLTDVDAAQVSPGFVGPKFGVTARVTLKTSDAFNPGDKVYLADGADSATVSSTDGGATGHVGNNVGIYVGPAVASAAAGQQGDVLIGCRYPAGAQAALIF